MSNKIFSSGSILQMVLLSLLLCTLPMTGCIRQTINKAPALEGTIIDSNSGIPLNDVTINNNIYSTPDGKFNLSAIVDRTTWNLPLMIGIGYTIDREVSIHKTGYRDTTCMIASFSMLTSSNIATIPLLKKEESEPAIEPLLFLDLEDKYPRARCQAFIGSRVIYQGKSYLIKAIHPQNQNAYPQHKVVLLPTAPNDGAPSMDIGANKIQLTSIPNITALTVKANNGDAQSQLELGRYFADGIGVQQSYIQAFNWVQKAAQQNLATAQLELAKFHATGSGTKKNIDQTMILLNKAAQQGLRDAQIALGKQYSSRKKTIQDYDAAHFWFKKAADQNSTVAMEQLAVMYVRGQGVNQDYSQSAQWLQRAIDAGSINAIYNLAFYYIDGTGVNQNNCMGQTLLKRAAEQKHDLSIKYFITKSQEDDLDAKQFLTGLCTDIKQGTEALKEYCNKNNQ